MFQRKRSTAPNEQSTNDSPSEAKSRRIANLITTFETKIDAVINLAFYSFNEPSNYLKYKVLGARATDELEEAFEALEKDDQETKLRQIVKDLDGAFLQLRQEYPTFVVKVGQYTDPNYDSETMERARNIILDKQTKNIATLGVITKELKENIDQYVFDVLAEKMARMSCN